MPLHRESTVLASYMSKFPNLVFDRDLPDTCFIFSIDPGTINMGFSLIQVDFREMKLVDAMAWTMDASKLLKADDWNAERYGDRYARIKILAGLFENVLREFKPVAVCSEAAFYNPRRPNAYEALLEVIFIVRETLNDWDPWKTLKTIEASVAKKTFGVKGNSKDKGDVKRQLATLPQLGHLDFDKIDEHACDALLIGMACLERFKKGT